MTNAEAIILYNKLEEQVLSRMYSIVQVFSDNGVDPFDDPSIYSMSPLNSLSDVSVVHNRGWVTVCANHSDPYDSVLDEHYQFSFPIELLDCSDEALLKWARHQEKIRKGEELANLEIDNKVLKQFVDRCGSVDAASEALKGFLESCLKRF